MHVGALGDMEKAVRYIYLELEKRRSICSEDLVAKVL